MFFGISTLSVYSYYHLIKKEKTYSAGFICSIAMLIAGVAQVFQMPWIRFSYFPLMAAAPAFYDFKTVLIALLFIPLLSLGAFLKGEVRLEEIALISALAASTAISLFFMKRVKRRILAAPVPGITEEDSNPMPDDGRESANEEQVISNYLESMFKPDEEINEILTAARNIIFADSVSLFASTGDSLKLRCSTEDTGNVIPVHGGVISRCISEKGSFVLSDMKEKKIEAGYLRKEEIVSLLAVPVMDGAFPVGVLAADSGRFQAFSSADMETLQIFAMQVMRILQRERIYPKIYRSYASLSAMNLESSKLLSTLNADVIVKNLVDGARGIVPAEVIFFMPQGKQLHAVHHTGCLLHPQEKKGNIVKGTLLDIILRNKEAVYMSDVRDYRSPLMPFKTEKPGSLFLLPLLFENEVIGILAFIFKKADAPSLYQRELLKLLGNQAAMSLANARFHEEIKLVAVTDGLTGLYNHRHFQEKLSQEFSRLERFSDPLSLMLVDIDHFKKINDTYGHPVGDVVLRRVGEIIRKTIRNIDIAARYGGEEFAVILLGTDSKGALKMAERLRCAVSDEKFSGEKSDFRITISIGISTYSRDIERKEEMVERADKALYSAKRGGRNQSILWSAEDVKTVRSS